ncbi:FecCD family ABC transporter permease [Methanococcus voltae]|uniref:Iron complex transport system permease protein n=2 Tax=Methanococcus voltae TaxID=2188 RepID=A0A8J7US66_METVO|nr:iron ABC transporter permease [Methanococcus voltae]MBP2171750.1 iron complex transport system permease protein [Methanococcus voltae]MBP2201312.1 iron complex transport system permease protein [Methanococcus voltae]MCS3922746.1 iron complex transport system permease protein [Methanococcus voltae PS]
MKKFTKLCILLSFILFFVVLLSLMLGTLPISISDILNYLLNGTTGTRTIDLLLVKMRATRTAGALLAGMGISLAGILMQSYFRNPLADPYLMGASSGATLGVVMYGILTLSLTSTLGTSSFSMVLFAYLGTLVVMSLVTAIAKITRQVSTLLISGIMVSALASGFTTILIYTGDILGGDGEKLHGIISWGMGAVNNLYWHQIGVMALLIIPFMIFSILALSKDMDANVLGDNYATSIGINLKTFKRKLLLISSILTATVVAFTGPIAFIGMFCPIIARMINKSAKHNELIPLSILLGPIFLIIADILTRPGVFLSANANALPLLCPLSIMGAPIAIYMYTKSKNFTM